MPAATSSVTIRLPARPDAPARARRSLVDVCSGVPRHRLDDSLLLLSEVVGNCVRHVGGMITVALECDGSTLEVAVADESVDPPKPAAPSPEAVGGRGLLLVQRLAAAWGSKLIPDGTGKVVWFRVVL